MKTSVEEIDPKRCVLCGSAEKLSGEHKVKASIFKLENGSGAAYFLGKGDCFRPKIAQSLKSKEYHFDSKICATCNSDRTQNADRAFHNLHVHMRKIYDAGKPLTDSSYRPNYRVSLDEERDIFRYFAKLLCCYIADSGGPRLTRIASYAMGMSNLNPINLKISSDGFSDIIKMGEVEFAFQGGGRTVTQIQKTHNLKGIQYHFSFSLGIFESAELDCFYPEIVDRALSEMKSIE